MMQAEYEKMLSDGTVAKILRNNLAKAIDGAASSLFTYDSDIRKEIESKFKEEFGVTLKQTNLSNWTKIITEQVLEGLKEIRPHAVLAKQVKDKVKEILAPAPESIDFEDLIEMILKEHVDECQWHEDMDVDITEMVEHTLIIEHDKDEFFHVYIDPTRDISKAERSIYSTSDRDKYRCPIRFATHNKKIYSLTIDDEPVKAGRPHSTYQNYNDKLISMYYAETEIENIGDWL